jgi:hypothetical protein
LNVTSCWALSIAVHWLTDGHLTPTSARPRPEFGRAPRSIVTESAVPGEAGLSVTSARALSIAGHWLADGHARSARRDCPSIVVVVALPSRGTFERHHPVPNRRGRRIGWPTGTQAGRASPGRCGRSRPAATTTAPPRTGPGRASSSPKVRVTGAPPTAAISTHPRTVVSSRTRSQSRVNSATRSVSGARRC